MSTSPSEKNKLPVKNIAAYLKGCIAILTQDTGRVGRIQIEKYYDINPQQGMNDVHLG